MADFVVLSTEDIFMYCRVYTTLSTSLFCNIGGVK